jgi:RNA polymerase sigma factor (sigma-70 family)
MNRAWKPGAGPGQEKPPGEPVTSSGTRPRPSTLVDDGPCRDFEDVYRRTKVYVRNVIRAHVPEAMVDDVFQKVYVTLARKIRDDRRVLLRIMHLVNAVIAGAVKNHRRVEGRRRIAGEPDEETAPSSWPNPEQLLLAAERGNAVDAAARAVLASVTEAEQRLLSLAHMDGLTLREIGELLDRPPGTLGVELQRAREKARRAAAPYHDLLNGSRRRKQ